jgi:uncharacterized protein YigE (DUF2233 family)
LARAPPARRISSIETRLSIIPIRPFLTKRTQSALKTSAKTMMRLALTLAVHLAAVASLHAAWAFSPAEPQKAPPGLDFVRRKASNDAQTADLSIVSFSPKTHTFAVMDNPAGAFDAGSAAVKRGALAAVNGGYFHPDRAPLGLLVRQGVEIHPLEKAKLLSGLVVVTGDRITLRRTSEFKASPAIREALQAGPFLVDGGKPVGGLENTRSAARTVVFMDSTGRFGFLTCKSLTLAETAELLATPSLVGGGKISRALNLDGGSSTALWVRSEPVFYEREWKSVRNYLAIVPQP